MSKRRTQSESQSEPNEDTPQTRIRRPREYRFEMRVGDEAWESAGLVMLSRNDAQTVKTYLNNLESSQEAGVTYRVTEQIILT